MTRTSANKASDSENIVQVLHPYGVGIDTHSKFIQVCVLLRRDKRGGGAQITRHEETFGTDWASLCNAATYARKLTKQTAAQIRYCIESTGCYHLPVLKAWKGIPSVVNPLLAGQTRRKTDVLDARLLAHHSITGVWKVSFIASDHVQELRVLWASRGEYARAATRHSNRINNTILRFGHTLGAEVPMRSVVAEGIIEDMCAGRKPVHENIAPDGLPKSVRPLIAALYISMRDSITEAKRAQTNAKSFIESNKWPTQSGKIDGKELLRVLQTVPGVGLTTAITWVAEVGNPTRFEHTKQVAAYSGCDPSLKVSAGKVTSHVRRAGNARLHWALGYAAQAVMQRADLPLAQWGKSIAGRHKKGGYRKAVGAVTRRIACALWHVHRLGLPYDDAKYTYCEKLVAAGGTVEDVVGSRYLKLLNAAGVKSVQQLADAYIAGELAKIRGFGDKALENVKGWAQRQREEARKQKHYALDSNKKFVKKKSAESGDSVAVTGRLL